MPKKLIKPALVLDVITLGRGVVVNLRSYDTRLLALIQQEHAVARLHVKSIYLRRENRGQAGCDFCAKTLVLMTHGEAPDQLPVVIDCPNEADASVTAEYIRNTVDRINHLVAVAIYDMQVKADNLSSFVEDVADDKQG